MKKTVSILIIIASILSLFLISCETEPKSQEFTKNGIKIVLTEEFKVKMQFQYTAAFESNEVAVFCLKEPSTIQSTYGDISLFQYMELLVQANSAYVDTEDISAKDGLMWFEFDASDLESRKRFHRYVFGYKSGTDYWMVEFAVPASSGSKYDDDVMKWAKSISFE